MKKYVAMVSPTDIQRVESCSADAQQMMSTIPSMKEGLLENLCRAIRDMAVPVHQATGVAIYIDPDTLHVTHETVQQNIAAPISPKSMRWLNKNCSEIVRLSKKKERRYS